MTKANNPSDREWTRRDWLKGFSAAGITILTPSLSSCTRHGAPRAPSTKPSAEASTTPPAEAPASRLSPVERELLSGSPEKPLAIVQWDPKGPDPHSILRRKASPVTGLPTQSLAHLDTRMRATLTESGGVGLAAPQVAVSRRFVLVELQEKREQKEKTEKKVKTKDRDEADRSDESNETSVVLACLDPRIVTRSKEQVDGYEACLSIDGYGGLVRRAKWVEVSYTDLQGRKKTRRATDWEARIFQHEIDHLDGILYVDRLVGDLLPIEEMRRRREKRRQDQQRQHRPRHGSPQKDGSDENSSRLLRPRAFASGSVVLAALLGLLTLLSLSTPARARKRTKSKRCDSSRYDCAKKRPAAYDRRIKIIRRPARGQDRACLRRLRKAGVKFRILARVKGVRTPVEILSKRLGGVRYRKAWNNKRRFILDCRFAEALVTRGSRIRRAGIASIYFTSSWRYTYLKGERELSRHAHGMALDISAIDGGFGYASVVSHYEKGKWGCGSKNRTKKGKALRALFCALKLNKGFRAILTPDNDRYHRDHFHVEGVRSSMRLRPKKSRRRRRGGRKRRK